MAGGLWPSIMEVGGVPSFPTPPSSPSPVPSAAGATSQMDSSQDLGTQDAVPRPPSADPSPNEGDNVEGDLREGGVENLSPDSLVDGGIFADFGDLGDQSLREGPVDLTEELRDQIMRQVMPSNFRVHENGEETDELKQFLLQLLPH